MASKLTVTEHLEGLPNTIQRRLYESTATCLAVFRLLPPVAKFYVMAMVFCDRPTALKDLDKWCRPAARAAQYEALKRLQALHLVEDDVSGAYVRLNAGFRRNFAGCLTGSASSSFGHVCTVPDRHPVGVAFLDQFAAAKWETILHFMVGTAVAAAPSASVLSLLRAGGLMDTAGAHGGLAITNTGFQFLLQESNAQIWTLLLQYLNLTQELNMDPVDVLNFMFMLGSLELGKSYAVASLSDTQVSMLADLRDYGLVYQRADTSSRFYPTRLATTLTSDSTSLRTPSMAIDQANTAGDAGESSAAPDRGSIIIETNFKVYSYTNSPLEIAILNLFVQLRTRFANMVIGQITRESIRRALRNGITADQIIKFLESHAHAQMKLLAQERLDKKIELDASNNLSSAADPDPAYRLEILPPNVVDQIKLWQLELDRIATYEGYLFKEFANQKEYDVLRNYASEIGVLLWHDDAKKKFFVTSSGVKQVSDFANRKAQRQR